MQLLISPETRARLIKEFHPGTRRGFIKMIIIIVVGIILISVLGFDIRSAVEHPQTQTNFSYLGELVSGTWNTYLAGFWAVIWNIIGPVVELVWSGAENFDWNDYEGGVDNFVNSAPAIEQ